MQEQPARHRGRPLNSDLRAGMDMRAVPEEYGAARPPREPGRKPWILRLALALAAAITALGLGLLSLSRKNMLLALGVGLFLILFIMAAYNAFFKQKPVARPVLFSTRAVEINESAPRPFVSRAISTEALSRAQAAHTAPQPPANILDTTPRPRDDVGELIRAQERVFTPGGPSRAEERHEAARPDERRADEAAVAGMAAAPLPGKIVLPSPRPALPGKRLPARERVLHMQKALRKAGDKGLAASGNWDAKTRAALRRFKKRHGLADNDTLDAATIAKMQKLHLW